MALPTQPFSCVNPACTSPMASLQVQLKGATLGNPNAERSPLSANSAARIDRGSAWPRKTRETGSSGVLERSEFRYGHRVRDSPPRETAVSGAGAGGVERTASGELNVMMGPLGGCTSHAVRAPVTASQ